MMRGIDFNKNWKFYLGEKLDAHLLNVDESEFKDIELPHDWSIEFPFDKCNGEACTAYLLGGIGWYRKKFETQEIMSGNRVVINFDGMYERVEVYVNGEVLGFHPYGYSPYVLDITDYLNDVGEQNIIALRVDHTRYANSRWYTGSGIYRKVTMHILPDVHIPIWGAAVETKMCDDTKAVILSKFELKSFCDEQKSIEAILQWFNPEMILVEQQSIVVELEAKESKNIETEITIKNPTLWEIHKGKQYLFKVILIQDGEKIQCKEELFGIRTFYFDVDKGFFFNHKNTLIKGVCLHHDAGALGVAVPLDAWRRRLEKLKECGCNAIRTAHNPASEDFLYLCDEMGFLVQEEFFDEWDNPKDKKKNGVEKSVDYITRAYTEYFRDFAKKDLQSVVLRDRNHPCIFQWSIGNEIEWTYTKYNTATGYFTEGKEKFWYWWNLPPYSKDQISANIKDIAKSYYDIGSTAQKLAKWVKEVDMTRPVTANCILPTASYENGYADALDLMGYSYRSIIYKYGKEYYGNKPIMGTENVGQWREWKAVLENEHISGIFLWTGIDHLGEAWVQKSWPRKGSNLGLLDFAGFEKPSFYMFKSLWTDEPVIHLETQSLAKSLYKLENESLVEKVENQWKYNDWHWQDVNPYWNYDDKELVVVECYSNCEEVTLYCNNREVEKQYLINHDDHIYKWCIPFEKGKITAVGKRCGVTHETSLITEDIFDYIDISTDKYTMSCDKDSVAHIEIQLKDNNGVDVKNKEEEIEFFVEGCGHIIAIDNGNPDNVRDCKSNYINTWHGKAMVYVQAESIGEITVSAKSKNSISEKIDLVIK